MTATNGSGGIVCLALALLVAAFACTTKETTGSSADASGGECSRPSCIGAPGCGSGAGLALACSAPPICARAVFVRHYPEANDSSSDAGVGVGVDAGSPTMEAKDPSTEANARCALEALRDGKIGSVSAVVIVGTEGVDGNGYDNDDHAEVHVPDDRRGCAVISLGPGPRGADWAVAYPKHVPLKPPSFFADCLASNDLDRYARCLFDPFDVCPAPQE